MAETAGCPETVLIRCPNWVGDIVMATPALDCLRNSYPEARILGCLRKYARGIVEDGPWFDGIIDCNDRTPGEFWRTVQTIRKLRPDMAVVLPNSLHAALTVRLGGARKIYGYRRDWRSPLLNGGPIPTRKGGRILPGPMVDYYLEICRWLDLEIPLNPRPRLFVSDALEQQAQQLLQRHGIRQEDTVIGLNPGASFGSSKCWPPQHFARLSELLEKELGGKILLFAGPGEEEIAGAIVDQAGSKIINTASDKVDLALLKPLIRRCRLLVTNDTGPRHFAVAFGVPVVVLMGPTDPRWTAANLEKTAVIREQVDCAPCHRKVCPLDHRCMTRITPEAVYEEARGLMERFAGS